MSLSKYDLKRDFQKTAEPKPNKRRTKARQTFVIQKHAASRLHYDLRLEMAGVLKSWAVPKGFPFAKGERHLAVHVEDHPLAYADFEGTIPTGQYGGGTVMVWDRGTYEMHGGEPEEEYSKGKLHLCFRGTKLDGEWTLVRGGGSGEEDRAWFLIKTGEAAKPVSKRSDDTSQLTGRSMKEIAGQKTGAPKQKLSNPDKAEFVEPMKAMLVKAPPIDGDWIYEVKWDGYRAIAIRNGSRVELISRNRKVLTFAEVESALATLPARSFVIDGEICALDDGGRSSFQLLQSRESADAPPHIVFYAFDLLHLDGASLAALPLLKRKEALETLLEGASGVLRFSPSFDDDGTKVLREVAALGMEGIMGKRRDSVYQAGARSGAWVKVKFSTEQEFVIGGYTPPQGGREHFGALLVGYYEGKDLHFAGKVGTGFDEKRLKDVLARMKKIAAEACPFVDLPQKSAGRWGQGITPAVARKCSWVRPALVCQVRFVEWTAEGSLRQPVYLGLREDKAAADVRREGGLSIADGC